MVCSVCKADGHNKRNCPVAKGVSGTAPSTQTPPKAEIKTETQTPAPVELVQNPQSAAPEVPIASVTTTADQAATASIPPAESNTIQDPSTVDATQTKDVDSEQAIAAETANGNANGGEAAKEAAVAADGPAVKTDSTATEASVQGEVGGDASAGDAVSLADIPKDETTVPAGPSNEVPAGAAGDASLPDASALQSQAKPSAGDTSGPENMDVSPADLAVKDEPSTEDVKVEGVKVEGLDSDKATNDLKPVETTAEAVGSEQDKVLEPKTENVNSSKETNVVEQKADANGHAKEEETVPAEEDTVTLGANWLGYATYRISGLGGDVSTEELMTLLEPHCKVVHLALASVEKSDVAFLRAEPLAEGDDLSAKLKDAFAEATVKEHKLALEPVQVDWLLFVGNLKPETDDEGLIKMFETFGQIVRAFVVLNAEGKGKGYGFVEFALKSQASAAKTKMGNVEIEGRLLRVEFADVKKPADLFSSVLYMDHVAKETPQVQDKLRLLFSEHGKVRHCQMVTGPLGQLRGFAFVDFVHSAHADKALHALDGHVFYGLALRVNFSNPAKKEQMFNKSRPQVASPEQPRGFHGAVRPAFGSPPMRPYGRQFGGGPGGGPGPRPAFGGRAAFGPAHPLSPQGGRGGRFGGMPGRLPQQPHRQPQFGAPFAQPFHQQPRPVARAPGPVHIPPPAAAQGGFGPPRGRVNSFRPRAEVPRAIIQHPRPEHRATPEYPRNNYYNQQQASQAPPAAAAHGGYGSGAAAAAAHGGYGTGGGAGAYPQKSAVPSASYPAAKPYQQPQPYKAPAESGYGYQQRPPAQPTPASQQSSYYGAQQQQQGSGAQSAATGYGQASVYEKPQAAGYGQQYKEQAQATGYGQQYKEQPKEADPYAEYHAQQASGTTGNYNTPASGYGAAGGYGSTGAYGQGAGAGTGAGAGAGAGGGAGAAGAGGYGASTGAAGGYGATAGSTASGGAYGQADPYADYYNQQNAASTSVANPAAAAGGEEQNYEAQWAAYHAAQAQHQQQYGGTGSAAGATAAAGEYDQQGYGTAEQQAAAAAYYQGQGGAAETGQKRSAADAYGYGGYGTEQQQAQQQEYAYAAQAATAAGAYGQAPQVEAYGDYKRPRQGY